MERSARINIFATIAVAVLAVGLGCAGANRMVVRPLHAMVGQARRMAQGDLNARNGVGDKGGDIGLLARAVDDAAAALQERTSQLAQVNADLEERVIDRTAELRDAVQELEAFSYSVSHDLRGPIRALDGFLRILIEEHGKELSPEATHYLDLIRSNTAQMGALVEDLLALSRVGRTDLDRQTVDPRAIVESVVADLQRSQNGCVVNVAIGELPLCTADPGMLRLVYTNLISNAFKFTRTREPAEIEIGARQEYERTVYYVRDNGVGFDPSYRDKLFAPFQRLHSVGEYEGTGIGLAIVERAIRRHGGRVWAEAVLNRGAVFSFTLERSDGGIEDDEIGYPAH